MVRGIRIEFPGASYHVLARGIRSRNTSFLFSQRTSKTLHLENALDLDIRIKF
jgi:hypothetical protein